MPKFKFMGPGTYQEKEGDPVVQTGEDIELTEEQAAALRASGLMLEGDEAATPPAEGTAPAPPPA